MCQPNQHKPECGAASEPEVPLPLAPHWQAYFPPWSEPFAGARQGSQTYNLSREELARHKEL